LALEAGKAAVAVDRSEEEAFIALTGGHLGKTWPDADYVCTAWEAETGTFRAWDRDAGVRFDLAVSSSCCVPGLFPPVPLAGGHYIDGGIISASNAFLAEGHDAVVVLSVLTGALAGLAEHVSRPLRQEVDALRAGGA